MVGELPRRKQIKLMDTDNLRIGIIGAGANTRSMHIPGFQKIPGVDVVVVANRSRESSQRAADEFGIPRIAENWQAVVADPEVDAICIGTWPYLHAEITCAALAQGKHVLTEARMARNLPEAEAMLAASKAHPDLVTQIVPSPMTLILDETIREKISSGHLGTLREITVMHTNSGNADASTPLTWRQDAELSGHNTMALGIFYEAVLRWMQEDVQVEKATAAIYTPMRKRADGSIAEVKIPESLTVLGRYQAGTRLVMHLSGVERGPGKQEIRIHGSERSLRIDIFTAEMWETDSAGNESPVEIAPARQIGWRVEADFVDSIRQGTPVRLTDFATGVRTMRFTDEVWSAWSGE